MFCGTYEKCAARYCAASSLLFAFIWLVPSRSTDDDLQMGLMVSERINKDIYKRDIISFEIYFKTIYQEPGLVTVAFCAMADGGESAVDGERRAGDGRRWRPGDEAEGDAYAEQRTADGGRVSAARVHDVGDDCSAGTLGQRRRIQLMVNEVCATFGQRSALVHRLNPLAKRQITTILRGAETWARVGGRRRQAYFKFYSFEGQNFGTT
ncbi:hypothetical protein K438DRAFT_1780057 [Mycena galopus ATCC 62051]|nr:hypothetical protein K438DRAFT_2090224 [Mycena galopus ATCC 62051]KAF8147434.1 hypothetical protein K438DRAFT_1780057 [Mycena galopus ATCC 62051]